MPQWAGSAVLPPLYWPLNYLMRTSSREAMVAGRPSVGEIFTCSMLVLASLTSVFVPTEPFFVGYHDHRGPATFRSKNVTVQLSSCGRGKD